MHAIEKKICKMLRNPEKVDSKFCDALVILREKRAIFLESIDVGKWSDKENEKLVNLIRIHGND